jgi:hypothetical protein
MGNFCIRNNNGKPIENITDWYHLAPPKKKNLHWKPGRSAMEEASSWFSTPTVPKELRKLFDSCDATCGLVVDEIIPEKVTKLDEFRGEHRNHDLVITGASRGRKVLACIEAKADESFGEIAGQYVNKAQHRNPRSKIPERFKLMCKLLFGGESNEANDVRYQLLTGAAGTIIEAQEQHAEVAAFVIHEFIGCTQEDKVQSNTNDLNRFVELLTGKEFNCLSAGQMIGPITLPENEETRDALAFFIGKCQRRVWR